LARERDTSTLTAEQKTTIARRGDEALEESHTLQLMLDAMESQDSEGKLD
jgi:hypothetical protein